MRPTVLIVDDHKTFRESATALLAASGFVVVGTAADGAEAVAEARRLRPHIVLLDMQLPDLDGFAVAERLCSAGPALRIVLTSSRDAAQYGARLPAAGTRGFIAKRSLSGTALAALVG